MVVWFEVLAEGLGASFAEAAAFGEIIILTTKGTAAKEALLLSGIENFSNKTIIDVTNPIADLPSVNGVLSFFTDQNGSLMELLQKTAPNGNFV